MGVKLAKWPKKSVYPLIYFVLFAWTVFGLVTGYYKQPPPDIIEGFSGEQSRLFLIALANVMVTVLGIYLVLNYLAFERFEHGGTIDSNKDLVSIWGKIFELILRLSVVAVVGLKIIKWKYFADVFIFITALCFLIALWHFYCTIFQKIKGSSLKIGSWNFFIAILAFTVTILMRTENGGVNYLAPLISILTILMPTLVIATFSLYSEVAENVFKSIQEYIMKWD